MWHGLSETAEFDMLVGKFLWMVLDTIYDTVEDFLFHGKELSNNGIAILTNWLSAMTLKDLKSLMKNLGVRLTGSSRKGDIIERLIGMSHIGAIKKHM